VGGDLAGLEGGVRERGGGCARSVTHLPLKARKGRVGPPASGGRSEWHGPLLLIVHTTQAPEGRLG
jgi:hypothetical protein